MRVLKCFVLIAILGATAFGSLDADPAATAISADEKAAARAIERLRTNGPEGLAELIEKYSADIRAFEQTGVRSERWARIAAAIDGVAKQKDAYVSGLYWYTDLGDALNEAEKRGVPVLSLRLLGNLDEEFSCANSRLFRAILYSNREISGFLKGNYVLHWRSVRPAPRITIDFGDGRKIERTVTGNSIHYIVAADGRVMDALPGLYSPKMFMESLGQAAIHHRLALKVDPDGRFHRDLVRRKSLFDHIAFNRLSSIRNAGLDQPVEGRDAISVAPVAITKMMVTDEISLLRVYDDFARFIPSIDLKQWETMAANYSPESGLDVASRAFIRRQNPDLKLDEFDSLISRLERFISLDTTRNDFLYRTKILQWLNAGGTIDLEPLNERVYTELFRTSSSDAWLGLYSNDVYAALDGNGVTH